MFVQRSRWTSVAVLATIVSTTIPLGASAQSTMFQACSQGALANCAGIRLTTQLGAGPGGTNLFQIGIQNLGSLSNPALPTSVYFLALLTGQPSAPLIDVLATPTASGGATLSSATPWNVAESGDAIFLSAPGNDGIGGCAAAAPVGGFGQMGRTCGAGQFITFNFFTPRVFNVNSLSLAALEFVAIAPGNAADSCNETMRCLVTPSVVIPEPSTVLLSLTGLSAIFGVQMRRRKGGARPSAATEV